MEDTYLDTGEPFRTAFIRKVDNGYIIQLESGGREEINKKITLVEPKLKRALLDISAFMLAEKLEA